MPDTPRRLWAPWRAAFLKGPTPRGCFLCKAARAASDKPHRVLRRGRDVFAILNLYPYNNGHVMVAPYRHVGSLEALTAAEWAQSFDLIRLMMRRIRKSMRPHGFNLGMNLGRVAGAGVPGHLHLHLVPRWNGDTNFMPVSGHAKVLSQSLDEAYRLLRQP
jgi:ATP adenylyltransferase